VFSNFDDNWLVSYAAFAAALSVIQHIQPIP